jgi:hypothetical protein
VVGIFVGHKDVGAIVSNKNNILQGRYGSP